jgi:hypothetical protein
MNKEKYNQIIDEAYENYQWKQPKLFPAPPDSNLSKEEFINKCKTDNEFSEQWGLKIEERELSYTERYDIHINYITESNLDLLFELADDENLNRLNVPTKLITVTYNDIKTETYE